MRASDKTLTSLGIDGEHSFDFDPQRGWATVDFANGGDELLPYGACSCTRERTDLLGRVFHLQIERSSQRSPLTETTFPLEEKSATLLFREAGKIKSVIAIVPFCA